MTMPPARPSDPRPGAPVGRQSTYDGAMAPRGQPGIFIAFNFLFRRWLECGHLDDVRQHSHLEVCSYDDAVLHCDAEDYGVCVGRNASLEPSRPSSLVEWTSVRPSWTAPASLWFPSRAAARRVVSSGRSWPAALRSPSWSSAVTTLSLWRRTPTWRWLFARHCSVLLVPAASVAPRAVVCTSTRRCMIRSWSASRHCTASSRLATRWRTACSLALFTRCGR